MAEETKDTGHAQCTWLCQRKSFVVVSERWIQRHSLSVLVHYVGSLLLTMACHSCVFASKGTNVRTQKRCEVHGMTARKAKCGWVYLTGPLWLGLNKRPGFFVAQCSSQVISTAPAAGRDERTATKERMRFLLWSWEVIGEWMWG